MGRRTTGRVCCINYPSRVEGWIDVCGKLNCLNNLGEKYLKLIEKLLVTCKTN